MSAFDLSGISDVQTFYQSPNFLVVGDFTAWTGILFVMFLAQIISLKAFNFNKAVLAASFVTFGISIGMAAASLIHPVTPIVFLVCSGLGLFLE